MQPTRPTLLARLLGFLRSLLGPPPRQLPPPPVMARPALPPRPPQVKVVNTHRPQNPWDAILDLGPEERTTLIEGPRRLTNPGLDAPAAPAARPPGPAEPLRGGPTRLPLR